MPEGDTVWLTARRLHAALSGRRLTESDLRVPSLATVDLSGSTTHEVVSRGKHLLIRLDSGLTLHSHLGMPGSWRVYPNGTRWRGGPGWEVRGVLRTQQDAAVGYRLRTLQLLRTASEDRVVGHLGPDLLSEHWDERALSDAVARLLSDPARPIGPALLDQRNLAGIGNLYKAEVLFLVGVTPWTAVAAVPDLARVVSLARELLRSNRHRWEQPTTGSLRRSEAHWVFERTGQPCRRCGSPVRRDWDSPTGPPAGPRVLRELNRVSYWCPQCQQGPYPGSHQGPYPGSRPGPSLG